MYPVINFYIFSKFSPYNQYLLILLKYNELKMKRWERFKPITRTRPPDPNSVAAAKKAKVLAAKMQWLSTRALAQPAKVSSYPSIPFVAGKSTTKSHNLGVAIQETKSLMKVQLKSNIRQKPLCFQTDVVKHNRPSTASITNISEHVDDVCPVLRYNTTKITNNKYDEEAASQIQNQTIEEIWANYMYEVESNNMIPLRCTCFPRSKRKPKPKPLVKKRSEEERQALQFRKGADPKSVNLYIEAQRTMEECIEKQKTPEFGFSTNCTCLDENNYRKPPKSKELADCMQKIKRIQEQLYETNMLMNK